MGGKGRKRREKNYRKAHGSYSKLPPPPDPSKLDALPSKLRQIMAFTSAPSPSMSNQPTSQESVKASKDENKRRKRKEDVVSEDKLHSEDGIRGDDDDDMGELLTNQDTESGDEIMQSSKSEKRKKKRKRKQVEDLRFEANLEDLGGRSKKKERKKKLLEERKKKHKKNKTEEKLDFPGRERIKFGDIVQAPPKLDVVPKAPKSVQAASRERLRLEAIEAYRNRKGWASRPGIELPPPVTTTSL